MLPRLRFFVGQAFTGLWRSFGISALSVVTIGLALGLLATFGVVVGNLARVADDLGAEVGISAYLSESVSDSVARSRTSKVKDWEGVADAEFVTSTAAMAWLRTSLGNDAIVLEGLPANVLPSSVEVRLKPGTWSALQVDALATRLRALPEVEDVRYGQEDIEKVNALLAFLRVAVLVITIVLCLATVMIVSNTIRLAVYARRDEIEIMSLIGATNAFVRTPFIIEGALQGLLGGALAVAALLTLRGVITEGIRRGLQYAYGPIELQFVPTEMLGVLLLSGVVLGLVGSGLAVGKFIRV